jgi:cell shape-determining protein MreD
MTSYRTVFISFACGVLLWTLMTQTNHYLTSSHLHFFLGGLLIAFPALRLPRREGWRAVLLIGLWCDAATPVPFGLHTLLFLWSHATILHVRGRFPHQETLFGVIVALIANAGLFAAVTLAMLPNNPMPASVVPRLGFDLVMSELVIVVISPWFFALHEHALEIGGVSLRRERRGLL